MEEQIDDEQKVAPAPPPEPPMSRRERRWRERMEKEQAAGEEKRAKKSASELSNNITSLIKIYTDGYNEYAAQNPDNTRMMKGLRMPWSLSTTAVPLTELIDNIRDPDLSAFEPCMSKEKPGHVNVMYFRVGMEFILAKESPAHARPGVPEQVVDQADGTKVHTQLFYHAVYPMPPDANAVKTVQAEEKLLGDFMVHVFCMGVDMQQMNNNNQWQRRLNQQTENLDDKVKEISEIFSHVGETQPEMKVS